MASQFWEVGYSVLGQTLAQKIIAKACNKDYVVPGEIEVAKIDLAMIHDSGGPRRVKPILDHLGVEKINLIGFSLGSLIALDFSSHFQKKVEKLILIGTTYKRSDEERSLVLDRYNQAKLNKPISKQALKRWFSDKYLEDNPKTYDLFMKILNKEPKDHKNFLKAYELFANHYDDFEAIKKIDRKTLVMTGSDDVGSTPAMSKELVKDLVNSTYIEIKNGKHLCSIECADDVNMKIKNFINN